MSETHASGRPGRYVQANGLDIYYEEIGNGPPLLMLHGGTGTIDPNPASANRFQVFAPNLRGHGRTANPNWTLSYDLLADDAAAFIRALRLDRPFVVGYSDGGNTALRLAMKYPGLARGYVLGGTWHRLSDTYRDGMRQMLGLVGDDAPDLEILERTHPDWVAYWVETHAALGGPDYWRRLIRQMWPMWTTPLGYTEEDYARITEPALILTGDRDETILVEDAVALYRLVPGAELGVVPAASHLLEGRDEVYNALMLDFLARHGTEGVG